MAQTLFEVSVDIQAPPARVWQVMADVERWHEWTASIRRIEYKRGGSLAPGATAMVRQPRLPPAVWKVTDVKPGASFTWVSRGPGVTTVGTHSVEPLGTGTRARLSLEYTGLLGPIFARIFRRITNEYLALERAGLKRRSETP